MDLIKLEKSWNESWDKTLRELEREILDTGMINPAYLTEFERIFMKYKGVRKDNTR